MQTVRVSEKAGSDGVLHLRIPVTRPEAEYEAVVVLQLMTAAYALGDSQATGWPPAYFEGTFGSITDETFVRPPQGELPNAVELQ